MSHSQQTVCQYWCSPNRQYLVWKTLGEYVWMWIALFGSILLYVPLFLWMRGNIDLDTPGVTWWNRFQRATNDSNSRADRIRSLIMLACVQVIYLVSLLH